MTHSQLLHDTKIKSKEFAECISTLIESKTIEPIKEEKSKIVYYRMLNHNNSSILPIPKILPILSFFQGRDTRENLENSNKLRKLDDITDVHARACAPIVADFSLGLLKERENCENLENLENPIFLRKSCSPNSLTIIGGAENLENSKELIKSPEQPLCQCGHPDSRHYEDGCLGDGGVCECKQFQYKNEDEEVEKLPENPCYLCGTELLRSQPKVFLGAGIGRVHETCMNLQEKAVRILKARYNDYPPCDPEEAARRIEGMDGYLSEQIGSISGEGIKLAISVFCKERGWNIGGIKP